MFCAILRAKQFVIFRGFAPRAAIYKGKQIYNCGISPY